MPKEPPTGYKLNHQPPLFETSIHNWLLHLLPFLHQPPVWVTPKKSNQGVQQPRHGESSWRPEYQIDSRSPGEFVGFTWGVTDMVFQFFVAKELPYAYQVRLGFCILHLLRGTPIPNNNDVSTPMMPLYALRIVTPHRHCCWSQSRGIILSYRASFLGSS